MPVFSDVIAPDAGDGGADRQGPRALCQADLARVIGQTESLLYRRGNFNGTFDDLICDAHARASATPRSRCRRASAGAARCCRARTSPGRTITNATAMTYPDCYRNEMTGAQLKEILEDVADNIFHPDPYFQQGGDMVRIGGMGYAIDVGQPMGSRISGLTHLKIGQADRGRARTMSSPAGPASTKARKARRSGMWCATMSPRARPSRSDAQRRREGDAAPERALPISGSTINEDIEPMTLRQKTEPARPPRAFSARPALAGGAARRRRAAAAGAGRQARSR